MEPEQSNRERLRDWWRELWPYLTFDAIWVAVGIYLLRKGRK